MLAEPFVEFFVRDGNVVRSLDRLRAKFVDIGKFMTKVGGLGAIGGGLALKPVVDKFVQFDDAIRAVKAAVGGTATEFESLREKALELGRETSFTAVEVAKLMLELGRAGFTSDQINVMTASVLNLARATGTEAATSAGIMSAAIRQFGLDASEATRVADVLTAGANLSFNSVESLGEALKYVGPVAKGMGVSLEETVALLGALGNLGIQGSEAGTALRRLITGEGAKAADFMRIFGVNTVGAAGNVRSLVDILDEVGKSVSGMGNAARAAKFEELFGLLGITSAVAISENAKSVRELRDQLEAAGGMAARTAKEMDAGLGGGLRMMKSAVEGVVLALGDAFAPILMTIAQALQLCAASIRTFVGQNQEAATAVAGVIVALIAGGAALAALGISITAVGSGIGVIVSGFGAVLGVVGALLSPVALVTAGIIALGVALARGSTGAELFLKTFGDGFKAISETFGETWNGITAAVKSGNLEAAFSVAANGIKVIWLQLMLVLRKAWNDFMRSFATLIRNNPALLPVLGAAAGVAVAGPAGGLLGLAAGFGANEIDFEKVLSVDVTEAEARLHAAKMELGRVIDVGKIGGVPAPVDGAALDKKRFEEHGAPPRPVLDMGQVKGGYNAAAAAQQFGYGDTVQKKQLDALKDIKDGKGKLAAQIGVEMFKAIRLG